MKIVALEEHFATAEVMQGWKSVDPRWSDLALKPSTEGEGARRLLDLGAERLDAMNEAGIDVLSLTTPGVQNLDAKVAVDLAIFQRSPCLGSSYHAGATPGSFGRSSKRPKRCGFHFTCTSNHQQGLDAYYKGFGEDIDSLFARGDSLALRNRNSDHPHDTGRSLRLLSKSNVEVGGRSVAGLHKQRSMQQKGPTPPQVVGPLTPSIRAGESTSESGRYNGIEAAVYRSRFLFAVRGLTFRALLVNEHIHREYASVCP